LYLAGNGTPTHLYTGVFHSLEGKKPYPVFICRKINGLPCGKVPRSYLRPQKQGTVSGRILDTLSRTQYTGTMVAALYKLDIPIEIVRCAIWTGRVKGVNPVSIILVASPESAKSQILLHFRNTPTLRYYTDVTAKALLTLRPEIESKRIRHIVLQDLNVLGTHKSWVSERIFAFLSCLMEEGITTLADPSGTFDWRGLPKIGLLAAITPTQYYDRRARWSRMGFITRFLSVHFTYTEDTVSVVHTIIKQGHTLPEAVCEPLPEDEVEVHLPEKTAILILEAAVKVSNLYGTYGFRFHKQFQAIVKGLALSRGRTEVTADDAAELISWLKFFNHKNPAQL